MIKLGFFNKRGFTLVEMLLVIALLSVLVLVAIPRLTSFVRVARIEVDTANAITIYKDLQASIMTGDITINVTSKKDITDEVIESGVEAPIPKSSESAFIIYATKESENVYVIEISLDDTVLYSGPVQAVFK